MRMRLGLLQDPAVIEKRIKQEEKEAEERRLRREHRPGPDTPTVKTEEQSKSDAEAKEKEKRTIEEKLRADEKRKERRLIKPLSEGKAIETGANFLSEAFVFGVGLGLLLFENWRSRRKEKDRRDEVKERLEKLEDDVRLEREEKKLLGDELATVRASVQALPLPRPAPPTKPAPKPAQERVSPGAEAEAKVEAPSQERSPNKPQQYLTPKDIKQIKQQKENAKPP